MAQASFGFYVDSGEEKLARIYSKIYMPLNITLDEGSDLNLSEREPCEVDIWSNEYEELGIYSLEEWGDPNAASNPPRRLIPCGTFAANFAEDSNWEENLKTEWDDHFYRLCDRSRENQQSQGRRPKVETSRREL